ncbi:MAG: CdaR family protein [Acidobacteriota bacterium]
MTGRVNTPMFLLAFVIAVAVKFTVHETEQLSERVVDAQVTYNNPGEDMISYNLVDKVKVGLRGKSSDITELTVFNVEVIVDLPLGHVGPLDVNLGPSNVRTQEDFEVISLVPNRFTIQVERELQSTIRIIPKLLGEPAAGARHLDPIVRPPTATVSGPESQVRELIELTAPVRLDGHARTFTDSVRVVSANPLVQVIEPTFVDVQVPMEEPELSISFEDLNQQDSSQSADNASEGSAQ